MGLEAYIKGWTGELKTKITNKFALDDRYKIFNNVILNIDHGSTQIDHVIVSEYGLFVIETKEKTGWIFGNPKHDKWTQVIYNKSFQFQNPLRQNYLHTKSISELLKIDQSKIFSIIVFWGDCEFKNPMPDNVFKGGFLGGKLIDYIQNKNSILFSLNEVERICSDLTEIKNDTGFLSGFQHVRELKKRLNNDTTCPKCGGELVKRVSNRSQGTSKLFLGCSNYPRCHYIKSI